MASITTIGDEARIALDTLGERLTGLAEPNIRIGVTGLSRAGKTVFISALVHNLIHGGRLPLFEPYRSGRILRAYLQPQPDDTVPRFQYENHIEALLDERQWPQSTRAISQLRLTIDYEPASSWGAMFSRGRMSLDIVDYPGEWLLDLPLLGKSYVQFSSEAVELARSPVRAELAAKWLSIADGANPADDADEATARKLAEAFTDYLRTCRDDNRALSTLPPGRFLMPGDMEGSPALTFAPLILDGKSSTARDSLAAMMERRYEAYKTHVIKPFFREHIARLDRQIVLVDAMQAINRGSEALHDLERSLTEILSCFRQGSGNILTSLFSRRINRILIAATKADQIHHESHNRLQAIARRLAERAVERANFSGAEVDVLATAAVRATREGTVTQDGETLPVIIGTPLKGEKIGGQTFDGEMETAVFPGDLPKNPDAVFKMLDETESSGKDAQGPIRFVRFRPPKLELTDDGETLSLPHIRLDRVLQFLIGDQLT